MKKRIKQTSIDCYHQIKNEGLLSKMKFLIYEDLYLFGPSTANEVFKRLNLETNQSGRFTELLEAGVIYESGQRECGVTGRNVTEWNVTNELPKQISKKEKQPIKLYAVITIEKDSSIFSTNYFPRIYYVSTDPEMCHKYIKNIKQNSTEIIKKYRIKSFTLNEPIDMNDIISNYEK